MGLMNAPHRLHIFAIVCATLILITLMLAGCFQSNQTPASQAGVSATTTKNPTATAKVETGSKYAIDIYRRDLQIDSIALDRLLKLKQVTITSEGKTENGPTLPSVLKLAGVTDYSSVTVYGYSRGRLATAQLTLQKAQVDDSVVLDISNQGTAKLSGTGIPSSDWVIDIIKIVVQ